MSGPFGSSQWMYSSGGFYDFPIEQSLRFNDDDSAYLSRTPASAGNRKTWTWSGWVKRGDLGSEIRMLFSSFFATNDNSQTQIRFQSDRLELAFYNIVVLSTNAVFRDTSAWYHVVISFDSTQATASNRLKMYVNGVEITSFYSDNRASITQNGDYAINAAQAHFVGYGNFSSSYLDGYLAEVNFIDGQALDASSFGEFKSGVWIPKDPSGLTYGTNGFRLSFQNDTVSEGFNAVTYTGNGVDGHSVNGLGQSPDLVWIKSRSTAYDHYLTDTVRGSTKHLSSNQTSSEFTRTDLIKSFDSDGFTLGNLVNVNNNGSTYVAWCWDAGSGSPVSNTDGSVTSTVKANAAYGFSVVSWTSSGSTSDTVGHGLSSTPKVVIYKNRDAATNWLYYTTQIDGSIDRLLLNTTGAKADVSLPAFTSTTIQNESGTTNNFIAYCFAEVAGYSKAGTYSGSGSAGNAVTTGFKPAFVMIKRTDSANDWQMFDGTRNTNDPRVSRLKANDSVTEADFGTGIDFTDTGFEVNDTSVSINSASGTYIYLAFADTRDNAFWRDQSGNGNDWQPNNLTYQDSLPDGTNNFAVLNPLANAGSTFSEGNLQISFGNDGSYNPPVETGTISIPSSGKYYFEAVITSSTAMGVGIQANTDVKVRRGSVDYGVYYVDSGNIYTYVNGSGTIVDSTPATFTTGDVIGVAYDADTNSISWYKNGTLQTSYTPSTGHEFTPAYYAYASTVRANFGQDSSFAGNKPAQGNTDDNGIGDFYYAPPSGYLALCTANLPDPVIDPAQDDVPSDYFNTVTWTGTGTTSSRSISGIGFQPDLVWTKTRSAAYNHQLYDAVRGSGLVIGSNYTFQEINQDASGYLSSFDADGFSSVAGSSGSNFYFNETGTTYVAWNWLAGNGTSSNTSGSITSTVSVNQKAGFSVVSYTGTGATSSGVTIGHGLGATPAVIITKKRTGGTDYGWSTWHKDLGGNYGIWLNSTAARNPSMWGGYTNINSTVFSPPDLLYGNESGADYINYLFAEVEGYSKFGSYTGNGSTDGPFVFTGFRPAFVIFKATNNASSWVMQDSIRDTYNPTDKNLYANLSNAEDTGDRLVDFLSNGFKPRLGTYDPNKSGYNYIYMAFAENPFKYANAR